VLPGTSCQTRAFRVADARLLGFNVDDIARRGIAVGSAFLVLELLSKGITIFPFFGVLKDKATMAQSEGLVVVCRLEVLQRFEDLHSPMNIGVMHMPKTTTRKE
jgi:hypothetical protein